jgi:hypothetical protein
MLKLLTILLILLLPSFAHAQTPVECNDWIGVQSLGNSNTVRVIFPDPSTAIHICSYVVDLPSSNPESTVMLLSGEGSSCQTNYQNHTTDFPGPKSGSNTAAWPVAIITEPIPPRGYLFRTNLAAGLCVRFTGGAYTRVSIRYTRLP